MLSLFKLFWFLFPALALFAVDPGQGAGAAAAADDPEDGDGDGAGEGQGAEPPSTEERKFTQADVEKIISERLERERKKAEAKTAKAKEEAEAKALADQQEWQKLAEKNGHRAAQASNDLEAATEDLEAAKARIKALESSLKEQLKAAKADLPEYILEIVDKLPLDEQMGYLAKHRESITGKQRPAGGVPPTPKPAGQIGQVDDKEAKARMARQYKNIF